MPKVQSHGKVIIDGKEVDLKDFDDSTADHTHNSKMSKAVEDELEKEVIRQVRYNPRPGQSKSGGI